MVNLIANAHLFDVDPVLAADQEPALGQARDRKDHQGDLVRQGALTPSALLLELQHALDWTLSQSLSLSLPAPLAAGSAAKFRCRLMLWGSSVDWVLLWAEHQTEVEFAKPNEEQAERRTGLIKMSWHTADGGAAGGKAYRSCLDATFDRLAGQ